MNENEQNNEVMPADAAAIEENQEAIDQSSDNEETSDNEERSDNEEQNEEKQSLSPEVIEVVNNFSSLLPIQDEVNSEIAKKLENQPS